MLYANVLIGPEVINTMRKKTPRAFADHGEVTSLAAGRGGRRRIAGSGIRPGLTGCPSRTPVSRS